MINRMNELSKHYIVYIFITLMFGYICFYTDFLQYKQIDNCTAEGNMLLLILKTELSVWFSIILSLFISHFIVKKDEE